MMRTPSGSTSLPLGAASPGKSMTWRSGAPGRAASSANFRLLDRQASAGDYSGRFRDPDVSAGEFGEDVEGPAAVLGRGGQVGAHRGEVLSPGEGTHPAGHLLLDLRHADVAFGRVVVEGNLKVGGEPQIVIQPPADTTGQRPMPAADRSGRPALGRGANQRGGDDQPSMCS